MFTPPRYIALDDDVGELRALVDALHAIGAPCVGVHYDPANRPEPDPSLFRGFRVLLTDLFILKGSLSPGVQYNALAAILDRCVPADHGPYLVVLWTSREERRAEFADRLDVVLDASKRPLAILALDKKLFQLAGGWDGAALEAAVLERLSSVPQLGALLSWERDVLAAANATLALVGGLVPATSRGAGNYGAELDRVLSLLGTAAAGPANARADPRISVAKALAPLLADRILNQSPVVDEGELWGAAVTFAAGAEPLSENEKGRMHRMLHFAVPPAEPVARSDWGALLPLSEDQLLEQNMLAKFGMSAGDLRSLEFKLKPDKVGEGRLVVVRIGAVCDQAQANCGPVLFILGLLVPTSARSKSQKPSPAVYVCPEQVLLEDGDPEPHTLMVHSRFVVSAGLGELEAWGEPILRIREQLLMTILHQSSTHTMRPGTLRF